MTLFSITTSNLVRSFMYQLPIGDLITRISTIKKIDIYYEGYRAGLRDGLDIANTIHNPREFGNSNDD